MKALTLHQPWATLVAIGAKRIETRCWSTNYRGPLAIHAAKGGFNDLLMEREPFYSALVGAGIRDLREIPLGAIVATCRLVDMVPILTKADHPWPDGPAVHRMEDSAFLIRVEDDRAAEVEFALPEPEVAFGDFSRGRYAWLLADVEPVDPPVPAKGRQGLWEWDEDARSVRR